MSALEKRYRRNFIVAVVLHIGIIGGIMLVEQLPSFGSRPELLTIPIMDAAYWGEEPEGKGTGLGAYKAPEPAPMKAQLPAPVNTSSDETAVPETKRNATTKANPNDIAIPNQKPTPKKPVVATTSTTVTKSATTKKPAATVANTATPNGGSGTSAADIRKRFISALPSSADGTAGGDNKLAGGGRAKGNRIGSSSGSLDGIGGGIGQGTPGWQYYRHIRDVLHDAWEQSGASADKSLTATVVLRIARDGSIVESTMRIGSGNKTMDEAVMSAVRRVTRLDPPPDSLVRGQYAVIPVDFQAEG